VLKASSFSPFFHAAPVCVSFHYTCLENVLAQPNVLAIIGYGQTPSTVVDHPVYLNCDLEVCDNEKPVFEVWRSTKSVEHGSDHFIHFSYNEDYLFGRLELDKENDNICQTAEHAYRQLADFTQRSRHPHLLRSWHYFSDVHQGEGDNERYKQFCAGRVTGAGNLFDKGYPAATVIGTRRHRGKFQMYWLASRSPGQALENPRQISAYHYPSQYSPVAPAFARAMLVPGPPPQLHISGTAAIVGHASRHPHNVIAQLEEIFQNFDALLESASRYGLPPHFTEQSLLKVYVRYLEEFSLVRNFLHHRLPPQTQFLLLQGDICRRELSVEIEAVHGEALHKSKA